MAESTKRHIIVPTKGICNTPSDLTCNDEQLEICDGINLVNGELSPTQHLGNMNIQLGGRLEYIHDYAGTERYLFSTDNRKKLYYYNTNEDEKYIKILRDNNNHLGAKVLNGVVNSNIGLNLQYSTTRVFNINPIVLDKELNAKRKYTSVSQMFALMDVTYPNKALYWTWAEVQMDVMVHVCIKPSEELPENGLEIELSYKDDDFPVTLQYTITNEQITEDGYIIIEKPISETANITEVKVSHTVDPTRPSYDDWDSFEYSTIEEIINASDRTRRRYDIHWRFNNNDIVGTYCGGSVDVAGMREILSRDNVTIYGFGVYINTGVESSDDDIPEINFVTEVDDDVDYALIDTTLYNTSEVDDIITTFDRSVSYKDNINKTVFITKNASEVYTSDVVNDDDLITVSLVSIDKQDEEDTTTYVVFLPFEANTESEENNFLLLSDFGDYQIKEVKSIGNTIIINTTNGLYYFLWKGQKYKALGDKIPKPNVKFMLHNSTLGTLEIGDSHINKAEEVSCCEIRVYRYGETYNNYSEKLELWGYFADSDRIGSVEDFFVGGYAKTKKECVEEKKQFSNPFFARVAVRLYDGSYIFSTSPFLLYPSINSPMCIKIHGVQTYVNIYPTYLTVSQTTDYSDYKDLVKDITIFITKPVETLEFNKETRDKRERTPLLTKIVEAFRRYYPNNNPSYYNRYNILISRNDWNNTHSDFEYAYPCVGIDYDCYPIDTISALNTGTVSSPVWRSIYQKNYDYEAVYSRGSIADIHELSIDYTSFFKQRDTNEITAELIDSCGNFYKLCDIGVTPVTDLDTRELIRKTTLSTLEQQEQLTDGYYSYSDIIPDKIDTYNRRLVMLNCHRTTFDGFDSFNAYDNMDFVGKEWTCKVTINNEFGEYIAQKTISSPEIFGGKLWFYYPDTKATHVEISDEMGRIYLSAGLKEHPHLNGAYYFAGYPTGDPDNDFPKPTSDFTVNTPYTEDASLYNYLIQSAVDNPLNFDASSYVRIGNGEIIGIAGLTTALNQDAYKVATLLCFTTQGIWAVKENDEGVMTSVAPPFSREVCSDSGSITMVDNGVFFVSQKGLMYVVADNERGVVCVSDQLSGKGKAEFLNFLIGCHIVYDYRDNQLILYRTDTDKVWIYSLESKTFSTKSHLFKPIIGANDEVGTYLLPQTSVNNYPDYIVQDENNNLFSTNMKPERDDDEDYYTAEIQSRPIKLDGSLYLKSLRRLKKLMMLNNNASCNLTLYGSNDLKNWYTLTSLQGKPWRFFKYKIDFNNLKATDTFSGLILDTEIRYTDKPH